MSDQRKGGTCAQCGKRVVVFRKGTSHVLHLILSILTAGLWLIVWLGTAIKFGGWRCAECGSTNVNNVA